MIIVMVTVRIITEMTNADDENDNDCFHISN